MPIEFLSMTHDLTTLLFGIYISALFLYFPHIYAAR